MLVNEVDTLEMMLAEYTGLADVRVPVRNFEFKILLQIVLLGGKNRIP